jgi:hypothetical protein
LFSVSLSLRGGFFIVNITQLRETIVELLSAAPSLIGSYVLPDNSEIPAVYVTGRQGVPPEWQVKGLEVTMQEFSRLMPSPALGKFKRRQEWTVILVNYNTASTNLMTAVERLAGRFPDARFSFLPESDIAYGQYRIVIPDTDMGYLAA